MDCIPKIKFNKVNEPYGCFSNFAQYPIFINDKEWPTNEHFFQAQKFMGTLHEEEIRAVSSPIEAAKMGQEKDRPLRSDWNLVRDEIMRLAVKAKVEQHKVVRDILLSTGNCTLIKHTSNDFYWADNGDGGGKNMLGIVLMEIRNSLPEYTGTFYLPQWLAYPDVHPYDIFWRMGTGEDYIMKYGEWFYSISEDAQKEYKRYFKPPKDWEDGEDEEDD